MAPFARAATAALVSSLLLAAAGCGKPTYPRERLRESVEQLLGEANLHTTVRVVNRTLAVHLRQPDSLTSMGDQIGFGPAYNDAAQDALGAIHRVLLSSDAEITFYVLLISDPNLPGAYLAMIRYWDDVRRVSANMLDITEFFSRTVFDASVVEPDQLTLDAYALKDIRMEEFLSWQLARRIQQALDEELQTEGIAKVGACRGEFANEEFRFVLNVSPAAEGALDEETVREVFHVATNVIARVLSSYEFDAYDHVRLVHPLTGRNLVLPKARLEIFR